VILTTVIAGELKERRAVREEIDVSQIDLDMVHIHDVTINYDYLVDLIAKMADEVHDNQLDEAVKTRNDIHQEIAKSDNDQERSKMSSFVNKIFTGEFKFDKYPAPRDVDSMHKAMDKARRDSNIRLITDFVRTWGIDNSTNPKTLTELIKKHRIGQEDMDKQGELTVIMNGAKSDYKDIAAENIATLSWVKYRIEFRKAFYALADEVKKGE